MLDMGQPGYPCGGQSHDRAGGQSAGGVDMIARASVATPKTDAVLREKYRRMGADAKKAGIKREDCPVDGLIKFWWQEGWDGVSPTIIIAQ